MEDPKEPLHEAVKEYIRKITTKGGRLRKDRLTPEQRSEEARDAAMKRWHPELKTKNKPKQNKPKQREEDFAETAA